CRRVRDDVDRNAGVLLEPRRQREIAGVQTAHGVADERDLLTVVLGLDGRRIRHFRWRRHCRGIAGGRRLLGRACPGCRNAQRDDERGRSDQRCRDEQCSMLHVSPSFLETPTRVDPSPHIETTPFWGSPSTETTSLYKG